MRKLLLIVGLLSLNGCSAMTFRKPSSTTQDLKKDWNDCRVKLGQSGVGGLIPQRNFLQECMEGAGWERE